MDLLFLGTSAGVPTKARNVSATAVIEASGSHWYLVDCGEGTQHRLLHTPLSIRDLRAIFITHVHGDHCFGLPGLLASAGMSGRTQPLDLVLPAALHDWVRQGLVASDTFLPFELRLLPVEELVEWRSDAVQVTSVQLSHRVPSVGFVFTELNPEPRLDIPRLEADGIPRGPLWGDLAKGLTVQHGGRRSISQAMKMLWRTHAKPSTTHRSTMPPTAHWQSPPMPQASRAATPRSLQPGPRAWRSRSRYG